MESLRQMNHEFDAVTQPKSFKYQSTDLRCSSQFFMNQVQKTSQNMRYPILIQ
jgi:hypothetical protein